MALFTLQLSDNIETVNFLGTTPPCVKVENGGFDISMPRKRRELVVLRPGFYVPIVDEEEFRESKITFSVVANEGAPGGRDAILLELHKIERILRRLSARSRIGAGRRAELSYTWEGASQATFFEVYGGDLSLPSDILSIEKMFKLDKDGHLVLPNIELKLFLSAKGYGISIYSDSLVAIPLINPSIGAKTTNPVRVQNPGYGQYNYVEINEADVPGSAPYITKLTVKSDTPYSAWTSLFIGHKVTPFSTKTWYDADENVKSILGSLVSQTGANSSTGGTGQVISTSPNYSVPQISAFSTWAWSLSAQTVGMFYAFMHGWTTFPNLMQISVGIDDYVTYGIRFQEDYTKASTPTVPLGVLQLPPPGLNLGDYGTLHPGLWLGLWTAIDPGSFSFKLDYVSLLPVDNGLRIWRARTDALTGTMVDDDWRGLNYLKNVSNQVYTPFFTLLQAIKLEPKQTQRLYFTSIGNQDQSSTERQRALTIQLHAVPCFQTLAY